MNDLETKDKLILQWKRLRGSFFIKYEEDMAKFEKLHKDDPLYSSVIKHFDKDFKQINQIAQKEIEKFLSKNNKG